ncbi:hypothetical protein HMPREF9136_2251 [Prevotella dentalis DSM 3688]|uniref:Uncharacterized protein n=1 Tax=Prevotella dentalis (strain ATCC 49559 / DSM 3688 / JCM 13448 / NCTC 12043 / ES 2772) TaxID=908937 RepID=F9D5X3_PREDD|nr:hypothetical protein HMPREF9136_2251 [Prevotella dentalis DSM 3688]
MVWRGGSGFLPKRGRGFAEAALGGCRGAVRRFSLRDCRVAAARLRPFRRAIAPPSRCVCGVAAGLLRCCRRAAVALPWCGGRRAGKPPGCAGKRKRGLS